MHCLSLAGNDLFRHGFPVLTHYTTSPYFSRFLQERRLLVRLLITREIRMKHVRHKQYRSEHWCVAGAYNPYRSEHSCQEQWESEPSLVQRDWRELPIPLVLMVRSQWNSGQVEWSASALPVRWAQAHSFVWQSS
jgi:hypothetical protein